MNWSIELHHRFADELPTLDRRVRIEIAAMATMLERFGPRLGRPHADTLKGSKHANMKELRFSAAGGASRSRSTPYGTAFCSWLETKQAPANRGSTVG